jgi:hypothetical protein
LSASARTEFVQSLTDDESEYAIDDLEIWLRPEQNAPEGSWRIWRSCAEENFPLRAAASIMLYARNHDQKGTTHLSLAFASHAA